MMKRIWISSVAAVGLCAAFVSAAPILSVDFNGGNSSATQSTFAPFTAGDGGVTSPATQTPTGTIGVTLTGRNADGTSAGLFARSRGGPGGTFNNLFKDWIAGPASGAVAAGRAVDITLTNLTPNGQYSAQVWSWESGVTATQSVTDVTGSRNTLLGTYSFNTTANPTRDQFTFVTPTVLASATGTLTFRVAIATTDQTASNARPYINGVELTAVPEPASAAVIAGIGALALRRRRRSNSR